MNKVTKSVAVEKAPNANVPRATAMPELSRWRRMQIPVIAWAAYWAVRLIGPTLRLEIVGVQNAVQIRNSGEQAIGAFWHRSIFPAIWIWRNRGIVVLNTVNFDGQWTRRVIERLGFGTAQGSSSRGAIEGLTVMARRLEEGKHVAFTIDGPRGPRYVAKPGPVILARRTGKPISVFHVGLKWAHTFKKSWDLFQLPYPFSRAVMFVAPPIQVAMDADSGTIKAKQGEMQTALERVRDAAESWFGLSVREQDRLREEWSTSGPIGRESEKAPPQAATAEEG
ncbi:MAG: lysophospholipid acyltransferase family protein [Candidatus Acidiferrales bacterium]